MDKTEARALVRAVLLKLDDSQIARAKTSGLTSGFHHGGAWFGPTERIALGPCVGAAAFNLKPDESDKNWWSAKVEKNAFACYEFLLRAAGGDGGTKRFVEATTALSDEDLLELLDEVAAKKKGSNTKAKPAGRTR